MAAEKTELDYSTRFRSNELDSALWQATKHLKMHAVVRINHTDNLTTFGVENM